MKIALVLMPWYRRESPSSELAMTSAILKKIGHEVMLWDINTLMFYDTFYTRKYWKYFILDFDDETLESFHNQNKDFFEYYSQQILLRNPDVIVFKCIGRSYDNSIKLAEIIKEKNKDVPIVICGIKPIIEEDIDSFINRQKKIAVDFVICGEDEFVLPKLLKSIENKNMMIFDLTFKRIGKIINCVNGPYVENLDDLPFFDFTNFDLNSYRFPDWLEIFMSKGCPWRCTFCVDWCNEKYRSMSGKRIFEEFLYQTAQHRQIRHFRFCDKTINGNIKVLSELCDLIYKGFKNEEFKRNNWKWSGDVMIRPEMTKELLEKMHRAGCIGLGYGVESGSDKVLKDMGKRFNVYLAERVIKDTHAVGIKTSINIMVGFPTETRDDFKKTLEFIKKNKEFIDEVRLTYAGCRIYSGSNLDRNKKRYNIISSHPDYWATADNSNNYEERIRRTEEVCDLVLSLGLELRLNSRIKRKVQIR